MERSEVGFWSLLLFLGGLGVASLGLPFLIVCLLLIAGLGLLSFCNLLPWRFGMIIATFGLVGFFYVHGYAVLHDRNQLLPTAQNPTTFEVVISGEPQVYEKYQRLPARAEPPLYGNLDILTRPEGEFRYGERLEVVGSVEPAVWPDTPTMAFPKITIIARDRGNPLRRFLFDTKDQLLAGFKRTLGTDEAALVSGLTFGARGDFRPELKAAMAESGTTHLVALSGYNVAIFIAALEQLLSRLFSRRLLFLGLTGSLFVFVLFVGGSPSIVRAAIMGWLILLARESGGAYNFRQAVVLAASLMCLFDPSLLIFDVGFQLSFLSLLGIAYLQPIFLGWWSKEDTKPAWWLEYFTATLAAQLAVLPLLSLTFGGVSVSGLVANVLILGLVPTTMMLGFTTSIVLAFIPSLGLVLSFILSLLLQIELGFIYLFGSWGTLTGLFSGWPQALVYYSLLAGVILHFYRSHESNIS